MGEGVVPNKICLLRVILNGESEPIAVRWYPGNQHMYRVDEAGLSVGPPFGPSKISFWTFASIR